MTFGKNCAMWMEFLTSVAPFDEKQLPAQLGQSSNIQHTSHSHCKFG